jgi:hypothetical protein
MLNCSSFLDGEMYTSLYPSDVRHPDPLQLGSIGPVDVSETAVAGVDDNHAGTIGCISLIPADTVGTIKAMPKRSPSLSPNSRALAAIRVSLTSGKGTTKIALSEH